MSTEVQSVVGFHANRFVHHAVQVFQSSLHGFLRHQRKLAELRRALVAHRGNLAYLLVPAMTFAIDATVGALILKDSLQAIPIVWAVASGFAAAVAVGLEVLASLLLETAKGFVARAAAFVAGCAVPCGLAIVILSLLQVFDTNTEGQSGADAKLWAFGAAACLWHVLLLLAGGSVNLALDRAWKSIQLWRAEIDEPGYEESVLQGAQQVLAEDNYVRHQIREHNTRYENKIADPIYEELSTLVLRNLKEHATELSNPEGFLKWASRFPGMASLPKE